MVSTPVPVPVAGDGVVAGQAVGDRHVGVAGGVAEAQVERPVQGAVDARRVIQTRRRGRAWSRRGRGTDRLIEEAAVSCRPVNFPGRGPVDDAADADRTECGVEHDGVVAGRIPPDVKHLRARGVAGGDGLGLGGLVVIAERGEAHERVAPEAIDVAEVILLRHVAPVPCGRVGQRRRRLQGRGPVLPAVLVDQPQQFRFLAVKGGGRLGTGNRNQG